MATIDQVVESAIKKARKTKSVTEALNHLKPVFMAPDQMFDPDRPMVRLPNEPIHAHKAFMDYIMFGSSNFSYWVRFRFPEKAERHKKYNQAGLLVSQDLKERLGSGSDWMHLASLEKCENWYKVFMWKARAQRGYDLMSDKLIKQNEEVQLEVKKEQLNKVVSSISELAMAIVNKALRAKLEAIQQNPSGETIKDIKALAELGINSHPLLKESRAIEKKEAQVNIQNNYHFNKDIAQHIHASTEGLE